MCSYVGKMRGEKSQGAEGRSASLHYFISLLTEMEQDSPSKYSLCTRTRCNTPAADLIRSGITAYMPARN